MWLHFILILLLPFALLLWLNSSIYKKLTEQPFHHHRTGQTFIRRREMRLGKDYLMKNNKTNVLCNISTLGRVSMMIVLVYFLCHTPKLCLSIFEITFKDTKVSNSNAIKIHNTKQSIFLQPLICIF